MLERRIVFQPDGLSLQGRAIVPDDPPLLVALCHGIPGSKPREPDDPGYEGFARELAERGFGAFWFDFRGVRGMPGEFSVGGWMRDLDAALDALDADAEIGAIPRIVVGSSAGGAIAIAVAARREDVLAVATLGAPASFTFGGLVDDPRRLLQTFRNTGIVHDPAFPPDLGAWWEEFTANAPEEVIGKLAPRPVLVMHGDSDDVVGYPHAERLFVAAGAILDERDGWRVPTIVPDTEAHLETVGIADLARNCVAIGRRYTPGASVTVSVGGFVPKPHTPFQWVAQDMPEEIERKLDLLKCAIASDRNINLRYHEARPGVIEGLLARGDRRVADAIERCFELGGRMDGWDEWFDYDRWMQACEDTGVDVSWYCQRERSEDEVLP